MLPHRKATSYHLIKTHFPNMSGHGYTGSLATRNQKDIVIIQLLTDLACSKKMADSEHMLAVEYYFHDIISG